MQIEHKLYAAPLTVGTEGQIAGYVSRYNEVDRQGDNVMPGAFSRDLATNGRTRPVFNAHDPTVGIGVARLIEDALGLRIEAQLELDLQDARDAWVRVKAGITRGLSIGYNTVRARKRGDVRELVEIALHEVSIVAIPALTSAQIDQIKRLQFETRDQPADEAAEALSRAVRNLTASVEAETSADTFGQGLRRIVRDLATPSRSHFRP